VPAWLLRDVWAGPLAPLLTRLLAASALYAGMMGWQPLLAAWVVRRWLDPPEYLDQGLKPAPFRTLLLAGVAALLVVVVAAAIAWFAGLLGAPVSESLHGGGEPELAELAIEVPSPWIIAGLVLAFLVTLCLLGVQALNEEVGWRGYFLSRLMQRIGPWRGLFVHGFVWGLWYAPFFLLANGGLTQSVLRSASFVVTCAMLGTLLGLIRLASRSVLPATLANACLTLAAGLPFILRGADAGLRSAAYGPAGWLPMAVLLAMLIVRYRSAVVAPRTVEVAPASGPRIWVVFDTVFQGARREPKLWN